MQFSRVLPSISVDLSKTVSLESMSFAALDDHALVAKIQAGKQAFVALVPRWQDKVYTQCPSTWR